MHEPDATQTLWVFDLPRPCAASSSLPNRPHPTPTWLPALPLLWLLYHVLAWSKDSHSVSPLFLLYPHFRPLMVPTFSGTSQHPHSTGRTWSWSHVTCSPSSHEFRISRFHQPEYMRREMPLWLHWIYVDSFHFTLKDDCVYLPFLLPVCLSHHTRTLYHSSSPKKLLHIVNDQQRQRKEKYRHGYFNWIESASEDLALYRFFHYVRHCLEHPLCWNIKNILWDLVFRRVVMQQI